MHNKAYQKSLSRTNEGDGLDFWRTPPQATKALMERENFNGMILEPACGTGEMSDEIYRNHRGSYVISRDIVDRGYAHQFGNTVDFLGDWSEMSETSKEHRPENVVTNPPFNLATEFIYKALEVATGKVAMLLKLEFLQAISRFELFTTTPLKTVYVFSYRVPFWQQGYEEPITNQRHAWYVWEHGYVGNPELEWIAPPEGGVDKNWWKKLV